MNETLAVEMEAGSGLQEYDLNGHKTGIGVERKQLSQRQDDIVPAGAALRHWRVRKCIAKTAITCTFWFTITKTGYFI